VNKNRLVIALLVLAGLAVVLVSRQRTQKAATTVEKPVASLPKLKRDELTKIELEIPEKKLKATLVKAATPATPEEKKDGEPEKKEGYKKPTPWNLTEPLSAKADEAAIENMLDKLADLAVVSVAASRKENHARLGVDKEHGVHVKAYGGDKVLADLYVGKSKSGGTMVRQEGEDVVVATKGAIDYVFDKELKYLRDRNVVELDPNTIKALSLSSAKGNFKFEKPEGGKWQQAKGEKPIKEFAEGKVESLVGNFARLHAVDFNDPAETPESAGLGAPLATLVLTPKEGGELKFELGKLDAAKSEYVLRTSANPIVYRVSRFTGDRMIADATAFTSKAEEDKGRPIAGGGTLPPEIMKQLQQQGTLNGGQIPVQMP
jgi:hypothetical protein